MERLAQLEAELASTRLELQAKAAPAANPPVPAANGHRQGHSRRPRDGVVQVAALQAPAVCPASDLGGAGTCQPSGSAGAPVQAAAEAKVPEPAKTAAAAAATALDGIGAWGRMR